MDPIHASYFILRGQHPLDRRFETPDWPHRVTLAAVREPRRRRATRRFNRLRRPAGSTPATQRLAASHQRAG